MGPVWIGYSHANELDLMHAGVYGWAENHETEGPHRMKPVSYDQYIEALEQALVEMAFIWPRDGVLMSGRGDRQQDRPDNSWLNRVRKSLGLQAIESEVPKVSLEWSYDSGVAQPEPMDFYVSNVGNCHRGHALWSLNGGPVEHIIPTTKVRSGEYLDILQCQEELEQMQWIQE